MLKCTLFQLLGTVKKVALPSSGKGRRAYPRPATNLRPRRRMQLNARCACHNLYPAIMMMKAAEDRPSNELAKPLDRPTARRILVQRQVRSAFVVIAGVGRSDPPQMALAEDNRMIKALPADRADQSFRIPVLPR